MIENKPNIAASSVINNNVKINRIAVQAVRSYDRGTGYKLSLEQINKAVDKVNKINRKFARMILTKNFHTIDINI